MARVSLTEVKDLCDAEDSLVKALEVMSDNNKKATLIPVEYLQKHTSTIDSAIDNAELNIVSEILDVIDQ